MANKTVSAESGSVFATLVNLWPYMWPDDRPDLKIRVAWAAVFLVVAQLILVLVPYFFKWATDALNGELAAPGFIPAILVAPVMLVLAYNVVRVVQLGFNQLRDALFAKVGQHAVRQLAPECDLTLDQRHLDGGALARQDLTLLTDDTALPGVGTGGKPEQTGDVGLLAPNGPADLAALLSRRHDAAALAALAARNLKGRTAALFTAGAVAGALHAFDGVRRFSLPMKDSSAGKAISVGKIKPAKA